MSKAKVGPDADEQAAQEQPDQTALARLGGEGATPRYEPEASMDGKYVPAEAKLNNSWMKCAYGVGAGAQVQAPVGSFLLDNIQISDPKKPLVFIITQARGFWREWKPYDGIPPREFRTEAEAVKAGLRTRKVGTEKSTCSPAMYLEIFVRKPDFESSSMAFTIMLGGIPYAPARFVIDKGQYREVEKMISNFPAIDSMIRKVPLSEGRTDGLFATLSTRVEVVPAQGPGQLSKTLVHYNLNPLLGADNKPVQVPEDVRNDLRELAHQLADIKAAIGAAGPDDEAPPALEAGAPPSVVDSNM